MKHFQSLANGITDRCATAWSTVGIKFIQGSTKRIIVHRQRALHNGLPGKSDQADTFAFEPIYECRDVRSGPLQSRWWHILCEHRSRHIDQDVQVAASSHNVFQLRTKLRSGQGHQTENDGQLLQQLLCPESCSSRHWKNLWPHGLSGEGFSGMLPAFF